MTMEIKMINRATGQSPEAVNQPGFNLFSKRQMLGFNLTGLILIFIYTLGFVVSSAAADTSKGSGDVTAYLPVIMNGYFDGAVEDGISGRVFVMGDPAAGIAVDLRFYNGSTWSTVSSVLTDESGRYEFSNIDPLAQDEKYYARYGANTVDTNLLFSWYGPIISDFSAGDSIFGGDFDIGDVPLISPQSGEKVKLPAKIIWEKRDLPGDTYRVAIIDQDEGLFWQTFDLGNVDSFDLHSLAPGMLYNKQYAWYVEVYKGPDSYGESFMLNDIIFLPGNQQQNTAALGENAILRGSERGGR